MLNCKHDYKSMICFKNMNKVSHEGTEYKFNAIEDYASSWIEKIIGWYSSKGFNLKEFIFVDPMSSSGEYKTNDVDVIDGTAMRIIKLFEKCAKSEKYSNFKFTIFLNDINFDYLECIKCSMERNNIVDLENFKVRINNNHEVADKDLYLEELIRKPEFIRNDSHRLVLYDPYGVDFNWNILGKVININGLDLILTHFYPNDVKRNIGRVVNDETKIKYSKSYQVDFNELEEKFKIMKTPAEKSDFLRKCLETVIRKYTNNHIHTSPIFNNRKIHVYDIVCISRSLTATSLLKDIMFKLYKENCQFEQDSLSLFNDETYIEQRNNGLSEFDVFYSIPQVVKKFWERFNGKTISKKELDRLLKSDPILPSNGLLSEVRKRYKYSRNEEYYIFEVKK